MKRVIISVIAAALIFTSGCAFSTANLNVSYDSAKAKVGPLSSVKPMKIVVGGFADKRSEKDKIGYVRNGFGMNTANVLTTRPVPEVVRDAVVAALSKNGHTIVTGDQKSISLSGSIERFWFESQVNFWTIEFMGTIDVELVIQDGRTGQQLFSKRYTGHHNAKMPGGYHKEMADVMNRTLENLVNQISGDPKLIETLNAQSASVAKAPD